MLRESQRLGHAEWDFGIGDMEYKWHYATHDRVIGPVGRPPLGAAVAAAAKARLRGALARYPSLLERARRLRKRALEARRP
jgi:CelD/BcsL family acetyltransferase involved in cellulose biosynthesis